MKILPQSEYLLQTETAMEDGTDQNDLSQATVNSANEDSSSEEEISRWYLFPYITFPQLTSTVRLCFQLP